MELPRYQYQALTGSRDIRVLKLHATETRIEVHVLHANVAVCKYQAISFVWGKADQEYKAIVLNQSGEEIGWIPLTENLHDALCDLRDTDAITHKTFWIDQICINQLNEPERRMQVSMMSKIYSLATRVITYLGPADDDEEDESEEYEAEDEDVGEDQEEIEKEEYDNDENKEEDNGKEKEEEANKDGDNEEDWEDEEGERGSRLLQKIYENTSEETWDSLYAAGSIDNIEHQILDGTIQLEPLPPDLVLPRDDASEDIFVKMYNERCWYWLVRVAYGEWTQRLGIVQEQLLNTEIMALRGNRVIDWNAIAVISMLFSIEYLPPDCVTLGREDEDDSALPSRTIEEDIYATW